MNSQKIGVPQSQGRWCACRDPPQRSVHPTARCPECRTSAARDPSTQRVLGPPACLPWTLTEITYGETESVTSTNLLLTPVPLNLSRIRLSKKLLPVALRPQTDTTPICPSTSLNTCKASWLSSNFSTSVFLSVLIDNSWIASSLND